MEIIGGYESSAIINFCLSFNGRLGGGVGKGQMGKKWNNGKNGNHKNFNFANLFREMMEGNDDEER
jgi:hypothetical protein